MRLIPIYLAVLVLLCLPSSLKAQSPWPDSCGYGLAQPLRYDPGGGGDTIYFSRLGPRSNQQIFDISSPVSLADHDRLIITYAIPAQLEFKRIGDDLAICIPEFQRQLTILNQYCRSHTTADWDTENNEIEEIRFADTGEVWLADSLLPEFRKTPEALSPDTDIDAPHFTPTVRGFSEVLPDYSAPSGHCVAK